MKLRTLLREGREEVKGKGKGEEADSVVFDPRQPLRHSRNVASRVGPLNILKNVAVEAS